MKAELESIVSGSEAIFVARRFEQPSFDHPFHYHPEVEIAYIERSSGTLLVGDHIGTFQAGDLFLLGSNLPHLFSHASLPAGGAAAEVLQFRCPPEESPGQLFSGAEWRDFRALLRRAGHGLHFDVGPASSVGSLLCAIRQFDGLDRWAAFIELARYLLKAEPKQALASPGYTNRYWIEGSDRMSKVCQYLVEHFQEEIAHEELARRCHLAPASFSRLFKRATRMTFQAFLNELRLGHACRLLAETDMTITEAAFSSGFRNLSNFNRRFKLAYACAPSEYRKLRRMNS